MAVLSTSFGKARDATGVTFTAQGAILGLLFGANRGVLISLNLIYFLMLQLVMFTVVLARTRSFELAWLSLALLISCKTIYSIAGGIYDYRIDFSHSVSTAFGSALFSGPIRSAIQVDL